MGFIKGEKRPPNAGRKKGSVNKVTADLKGMTLAALDKLGGIKYLTELGKNHPQSFVSLLGKILPTQVNATMDGEVKLTHITRRIIDPREDKQ